MPRAIRETVHCISLFPRVHRWTSCGRDAIRIIFKSGMTMVRAKKKKKSKKQIIAAIIVTVTMVM